MSKASDVLRCWADDPKTANDTIRLHLRAVADLMEAMDGDWMSSAVKRQRMRLALSALERAVTGESDGKTE